MSEDYSNLSTKELADEHMDLLTRLIELSDEQWNQAYSEETETEIVELHATEAELHHALLQRADYDPSEHKSRLRDIDRSGLGMILHTDPDVPFAAVNTSKLAELNKDLARLLTQVETIDYATGDGNYLHAKVEQMYERSAERLTEREGFDLDAHRSELIDIVLDESRIP
jgi:hypothetical protein